MNLEVNPIQFLVSGGPSFIVFPHSLSPLFLSFSLHLTLTLLSLSLSPAPLSLGLLFDISITSLTFDV